METTINVRSAVVASQPGQVSLTKHRFVDFLKACKANGNTEYSEILNPKAGKAPCFVITKPGTEDKVFVVLSKGVSELRAQGKLPDATLKTLFVIDGKNSKGESRWYLSRNGITNLTIDEAIVAAEQSIAAVNKLSADKLESLMS
jgi:hypothetical protein